MSSPEIIGDPNSLPPSRQNAVRSNTSLLPLIEVCGGWLTHLDQVEADEPERRATESQVKGIVRTKLETMLADPGQAKRLIDDLVEFSMDTAKERHELAKLKAEEESVEA